MCIRPREYAMRVFVRISCCDENDMENEFF